ncbi:TonB-dependent receptor [Pseudoalteromonas xiamenensis]
MSMFKPSMLTLALVAAGVSSYSSYAAEEQAQKEDEKAVEVIEVKGFRASVVESINTKRFSTEVVESISAEDIGKLPDSSIAESIARLPGLTAQRLDGRASRVSIRGFGENESATMFNGREQVSISDNRGVEFDLYPSEIMSAVTVYKTPSASLEAEGIAGVINMQTIKPLSVDERALQFNGQVEETSFDKLNPDGNKRGYRGTISYIDKFADDTIGIAFAYTSMSSPNQEKRWNAWGYPEFEAGGKNYSILGGAKPFVRSSTLERDSVMFVLEAAPSDKLSMVFDALYVDFKDEKILRGIEIPFAWGQGQIPAEYATVDDATGFITSAATIGQRVVVRNDYEDRKADLKSFGFNTKYDIDDQWRVEFDASYSKVEREVWSLESYSGTGRGDGRGEADNIAYAFNGSNAGAQFGHNLDYSDYNLIKIGGPLSWGWSSALNEKYGVVGTEYENQLQDGFINAPTVDDELKSLKLAAKKTIESDFVNAVEFGVSYRDREKTKVSEGYFMTVSSFSYPDNPGMLTVPEKYRLGTANLDFIGMGNMIAYDSRQMVADGMFGLLAESLTNPSHATKSWSVSEEVTAAFVQANIDAEVAGFPVKGNAGLRYVRTQQASDGNAFGVVAGKVQLSPTHIEHDYSHLLPSLNLSMTLDDTQTLRFGAAKTISRPRLDEMNASINAKYNLTPDSNGNYWEVEGGNPTLEPKEAIGVDLTYENYFSPEGYFSVAVFNKNLTNWIFDGNYAIDMTGVADPSTGEVPPNSQGTGKGKVNGGGGTLWGYELSLALPFNLFHESLEGFGLIASHTKVKSDIQDHKGDDYQLPGLSDTIQSLTVYYERNGFQARTSMRKRDDFKGEVYGLGFNTDQVDIVGETIWDAQVGYDFSEGGIESLKGLTVTFQVQNITEEPFTSLSGDNALQVRDYQDYGRTYLLGFSYKY